jgi:hypothetical protein
MCLYDGLNGVNLYSIIFDSVKYRILLFYSVLSLVLVIVWQQVFHLPAILILLHLIVATAMHGLFLISIAGIYRVLPSRVLASVLIGAYSFAVLLFYLLIFGSVRLWGDIVTVKILGTYFRDFGGFLHSMPFSYRELVIMIVVFIATPILIATTLSRQIGSALADQWSALLVHKRIILIAVVLIVVGSPFLLRGKRYIHLRGEPLLVMLFDHMWGTKDNPLFSERRIEVGFNDSEQRREYAKENHRSAKKT